MTDVHWVQVGSQYFAGGEGSVGLFIESVRGLDELPDARASLDRVPQAHGSFEPTSVWRDSLAITISGVIHGEDRADAERRRDVLKNELAGMLDMRVSDTTGVWNMRVRVDNVRPSDMGAWSAMIPFTIDMIAPDPVRYSDVLTAGPALLPVQVGGLVFPAAFPWDFGTFDHAKAVVTNTGALPMRPRIIIESLVPDGPVFADSITVFAGPRRLEFGPFSGRLVFDAVERRAWLNGVDVTRQIIRREWPVVGPGETQEFYFEAVNPSPNISLLGEYKIGVW